MPHTQEIRDHLIVEPGQAARLRERDTAWLPDDLASLSPDERKARSREQLRAVKDELAEAQERLEASDTRAVFAGVPGPRRRRQGRHHQTGLIGAQPARLPGALVPQAHRRQEVSTANATTESPNSRRTAP